MKIGVVGYSSNKIDQREASKLLRESFITLIKPGAKVEIVTGLTNIGIPKLAYEIAEEESYVKVGISAKQAYDVACGIYPVDKEIIHGDVFGDESEVFIDYIEYLVRVGGGNQSRGEVELFKKKCIENEWLLSTHLVEKELELK